MRFKICTKCGESKPLSAFYADRADCKECKRSSVLLNKKATGDFANRQHRKRYPERERARNIVSHFIKTGAVTKEPCWCGDENTVAHHDELDDGVFTNIDSAVICRRNDSMMVRQLGDETGSLKES